MRSEDQMIGYDNEIQNHEQFVELLIKLRKLTKYIVIVQLDRWVKDDPLIFDAMDKMRLIEKKKVREWLGTMTHGYGVYHEFDVSDKSFFDALTKYEAFYYIEQMPQGWERVQNTDFGIDDIAFLDKDHKPLFYTTTHEGYAAIHPDVLEVDISWVDKKY